MVHQLKLLTLITIIIITGSTQLIIIPLIIPNYPSIFFVTVILAVESVCMFAAIMLIYDGYGYHKRYTWAFNFSHITSNIKLVIISGTVQFLIATCFFYASHPARTPILIQVILLGMGIIPSVVLSRLLLNKQRHYTWRYIGGSLCFLTVSIFLGVVPVTSQLDGSLVWCAIYAIGVILISYAYVIQEKYIDITTTDTHNKFKLAFFARFIQLILTILMFWIEPILGYNGTFDEFWGKFYEDFSRSIHIFGSNMENIWIIQLYVVSRVISYILLIYLNQISSNYATIIGNINTQFLALFFVVFPGANKGFQYPMAVTMLNIFCNICCIILWIKGEHVGGNESVDVEMVELNVTNKQSMFRLW